ncbi:hypothetical protein MATL_G00263990 [Megalops atlanticus]|uniref:Uncharacterized protein n=1 Tax=Megalops atlanticus TaxID=7932 RepID=A0A9D3PAL1_MEGAT|nr:hypothetical protein MATL_G00263990 [Megalops atlanticus]
MDPPTTRSYGTQLSMKTLTPPFRSRGIQTDTVSCTDVGVGTLAVRASGQLLTSTPCKRPRLELEEEEDDPLEEWNLPARSTRYQHTSCMRTAYWSYLSSLQQFIFQVPPSSNFKKIFQAMQLQLYKYTTFRKLARRFIEPAIVYRWKTMQDATLEQLSHNRMSS